MWISIAIEAAAANGGVALHLTNAPVDLDAADLEHLGESPETLKAAQERVYEMLNRFYRLMIYAQLQFDIDQGNSSGS